MLTFQNMLSFSKEACSTCTGIHQASYSPFLTATASCLVMCSVSSFPLTSHNQVNFEKSYAKPILQPQKEVIHMGVSTNGGTPKSSILMGFSIIDHPFWGIPIYGNPHVLSCIRTSTTRVIRCVLNRQHSAPVGPSPGLHPQQDFDGDEHQMFTQDTKIL